MIRSRAGGTVEESAKGLRSIALIFPMIIFLMLTILMVQLQSFQNMFLVISLAPLGLIGFGIEMPMSLTILGVFGGFIGFGFLGLFIGATLIATCSPWSRRGELPLPVIPPRKRSNRRHKSSTNFVQ